MKDPGDFFYEGAGRGAAVEALFESVHRAEPLILISAPTDSGRSMVVRRFASLADPDVLAVAVVTGDIMMSAAQCCGALCGQLADASPLADDANSTDNFPDLIAGIRTGGRTPVFVLDDAHELGEETRLAVLALARVCSVPLILVGDQTLSAAMDADVVPVSIGLPTLTEQETEDFVAAWFPIADEDELPSHRVMARLHRQSHGLPGAVVKLLQSGAARRNKLLPAGLPVWHVISATTALLLLLWLVIHAGAKDAGVAPAVAVGVAIPLPVPGQIRAESGTPLMPGTLTPGTARTSKLAVPAPIAAVPFVPSRAPAQAAAIPESPPQQETAPRYSLDEEALRTEAGSRFTLQLFAGANEQSVRQLASRHAPIRTRIFRTVREGAPWYVAVTGSYGGKEGAQAAVARLPTDLQALRPWARNFQGIQDELQRRE